MASAASSLKRRCDCRYFGNGPRFWLNLQTAYELAVAEAKIGARVIAEVQPGAV
jgi:plasmid maintenance system antidote protein VapI